MATIEFRTSAVIPLLILTPMIVSLADGLHSAEPPSHCDYERMGQDANCQVLYQQIPQDGKNICLHSMMIGFLSTGDLKMGSLAFQVTEEYINGINQSAQEETINDPTIHISIEGAQWLLCLQGLLSDLLKLAKNQQMLKAVETNWTDAQKNYEKTYHHPASAYWLAKTTGKYLHALYAELNDTGNLKSSYNISTLLTYPWIFELLSNSEQTEQLVVTANLIKKDLSAFMEAVDVINCFVNPAVYGLIFILGVILNGTMIIICARHKELRTPPNIMLFNLAFADILNLIVNVPLALMFKKNRFGLGKPTCRLYLILRHMSISVSALSIVALSWQRYMAVINAFKVPSDFTLFIYILVVWLIALGDGLLNSLILDDPCYTQAFIDDNSKILDLNNFVLYCVFLPVAMVITSVLTALKLNNSAKAMPGAHTNHRAEIARYRSAKIVASLAIVFLISNIPISSRYVLYTWFSIGPSNPLHTIIIDSIFFFLLFSNSWFNPIALYIASKLFRGYFQRYLFCPFLRAEHTRQPSQTTKSVSDDLAIVKLSVKVCDSSFH